MEKCTSASLWTLLLPFSGLQSPCPPLVRRGWCKRLGSVHCCSFHFIAPFFLLSYFIMGSSAGHSPFRVVPPPESPLCPCLGQPFCLSISPALLALLPWHCFCFSLNPCFGVSSALALSPVSPPFFSIAGALASLLHFLLSVCSFSVYCLFLCICFCRGAMCSSGSVLMCNGSILSIAELARTNCDQPNAVHDHLLHKYHCGTLAIKALLVMLNTSE